MKTPVSVALAALITTMLLVSGCSDGGPSSKVFVKSATGKRLRVAVLPFDNVSKDQDAGRVVTNTVITYLLSTGAFDVVEPGVVNAALNSESVRLTDGLTVDACQKLQPRLNADAYVTGMVEDYGEIRIGPDAYPSISFSARLLNARTADIVWAASISKTGADKVKFFDIGRVSSLGKLTKQAVSALSASLLKSKREIIAGLALSDTAPSIPEVRPVPVETPPTTPAIPVTPTTPTTTPIVTTPPTAPTGTGAKYLDESTPYGEKEITALLKDFDGAKVGEVSYKKHFHDTVDASYTVGGHGKTVEVKLVDYLKTATSLKFIQGSNSGAQQTTFEALPAFIGESGFGYYHLDIAVGRFGLYVRGPKENKADVEAVGKGVVALLK